MPPYPPPPYPPPTPGPPPRRRSSRGRRTAAVVAATVLVVAAVVVGALLITRDNERSPDGDTAGPTSAPSRDLDASSAAPTDGATKQPTTRELCAAFDDLGQGLLRRVDPSAPERQQIVAIVEVLHRWAERVEQLGTPPAMPDRAQRGLGLLVQEAAALDVDEVENLDDLDSLEDDFTAAEQASVDAFEAFLDRRCETTFGGDG